MSEYTPLGTTRRLRALAVMGFSLERVRDRTGLDLGHLDEVRRGSEIVPWEAQVEIARFYRSALINPLPESPARDEVQRDAISRGWQGPAAWDDPDHDEEPYPDHQFLVDFVIENPGLRPVELREIAPARLGMTKDKCKINLRQAVALRLLERVRRDRKTYIYAI